MFVLVFPSLDDERAGSCCCGTSLYHFSMVLGFLDFPVNWKLKNLVPVFIKGKKEDPANCSPVSLTSVPRKIDRESCSGSYKKL